MKEKLLVAMVCVEIATAVPPPSEPSTRILY